MQVRKLGGLHMKGTHTCYLAQQPKGLLQIAPVDRPLLSPCPPPAARPQLREGGTAGHRPLVAAAS